MLNRFSKSKLSTKTVKQEVQREVCKEPNAGQPMYVHFHGNNRMLLDLSNKVPMFIEPTTTAAGLMMGCVNEYILWQKAHNPHPISPTLHYK